MAFVTRLVLRELSSLCQEFEKDPRVQHLPLVGSPIPSFSIIILYVLFVKKWGPQWMSDRKPLNVKFLIQLHNVLQILLNGYAFGIGIWNSYLQKDYSFTCEPVEYHNSSQVKLRLLHASYIYYLTKYLDLFDTIFFVLRKKESQITFLHVYHHAIMVFAVWLYLTLLFGGHPTMLGIINTFVHTIMYTYYLLSTLNLKADLTPWKKLITQIQILQFCCLVVHFAMPVINNWCNLPLNPINSVAVIQNIFMAAMFSDFYYKTYIRKRANANKEIMQINYVN